MPKSIIFAGLIWLLVALGGLGADLAYILEVKEYLYLHLSRTVIAFAPGALVSIVALIFAVRVLAKRAEDTLGAGITSIVAAALLWIGVAVILAMTVHSGMPNDVNRAVIFASLRGGLCLVAGILALGGRGGYKACVARRS